MSMSRMEYAREERMAELADDPFSDWPDERDLPDDDDDDDALPLFVDEAGTEWPFVDEREAAKQRHPSNPQWDPEREADEHLREWEDAMGLPHFFGDEL